MPISQKPDIPGVLHTVLSGEVTDDELLAYYEAPFFLEFTGVWREVVDGRAITHYAITTAGQHRLAEFARKHVDKLRGGRVAMVASSDVAFGMFRMWQLQRDGLGYAVEVFRDFDEAITWLLREYQPA